MKKTLFVLSACTALFAACSETDLYEGEQEEIQTPAEQGVEQEESNDDVLQHMAEVFGVDFDLSKDWSMLKNSKVTITADAVFTESEDKTAGKVVKVQVLTANPFTTETAYVLNEAAANPGEKVELVFDAPASQTTLYAACISENNQYRVKDFTVGQTSVSFLDAPAKARHRAEVANPTVGEGTPSWNAKNVLRSDVARWTRWAGKDWDDTLFDINATIEAIDNFTDVEKQDYYNYIQANVPEKSDNRNRIKLSNIYINSANYMTSTGESQSITVTPFFVGGTYYTTYRLYYYYFDPAKTVGMGREERVAFLEKLPKFKLLDQTKADTKVFSGWYEKNTLANVVRNKRFTLAYFGDENIESGVEGTYQFPKGYYIGFMLQHIEGTNLDHNNNGEFYGDSLLNNEVNYFGDAAKAKMGDDATRAAIFGANGKNFISFEDKDDNDFNDVVFEVAGGVKIVDPGLDLDRNVYTYAFEDRDLGDYDLNDVVVKAQRIDRTHVKYSLEACGAWDELYLKYPQGKVLNSNKEIHAMFGVGQHTYVNTRNEDQRISPIQETIEVAPTFSFADPETEVYIYNKTTDKEIRIAKTGEDPHAILIPNDFCYPVEQTVVKDAYKKFNEWGQNRIDSTSWYLYGEDGKIYLKSIFK